MALLARLRLPPDTVERHKIVARLLGPVATVLDVGGVRGQLAAFLPRAAVTAVNVTAGGDRRYDGGRLPFGAGAFEAVTSLDVLEHIPPSARGHHLRECLRVAARRVVLCCPLGTPEHVRSEAAVAAWHEEVTGARHPFLEEHLALGLPSADELAALAALAESLGGRARLAFHGDFRRIDAAFRTAMLARHRPGPRTLALYARTRLAPADGLALSDRPEDHTNRAFLVVEVTAG